MLGTTNKRTDAQIYILGHKPLEYGYLDNQLYTPLQVGAYYKPQFLPITDAQGDNIGQWNTVFAETTGMYWIAHNAPETLKYVGCCQYRRRILIVDYADFDEIFSKCQIICSEPLHMAISVYQQYCHCHTKAEIDTVKEVIADLYPEYMDSWNKFIENGNDLIYSSGFVMKTEDFKRYIDFYTSIMFETLKRMGLNTPEEVQEYAIREMEAGRKPKSNGNGADKGVIEYQRQIAAFLQERIATLFIFHNFNKIAFIPFTKMENI